MVLTILEAAVEPERARDLKAAFLANASDIPEGLIRSHLISSATEPNRWRIETLWSSRESLIALRQNGATPAGILMFRAAGAEPSFSLYEVTSTIEAPRP